MKWTKGMKMALLMAVSAIVLFSTRALGRGGFVTVTDEQIKSIDPRVKRQVATYVNQAMYEAGIVGMPRESAFLAQVLHETGGMQWLEEIASGAAYEGRKDLGNTQPGDGKRFKGRGMIMITGRANYTAAGKDLGLDLVGKPEMAAQPEISAKVAAWYWNRKDLNALADAGEFDKITKKINGGLHGKAERDRLYLRAQKVLSGEGLV